VSRAFPSTGREISGLASTLPVSTNTTSGPVFSHTSGDVRAIPTASVQTVSMEFVNNDFLHKLKTLGDGSPYEVIEENYEKVEVEGTRLIGKIDKDHNLIKSKV